VLTDGYTSPRSGSLGLHLSGEKVEAIGGAQWINGKEVPHGNPILDPELENAEEIDGGFTACESRCVREEMGS
jgi:hypothetical protein